MIIFLNINIIVLPILKKGKDTKKNDVEDFYIRQCFDIQIPFADFNIYFKYNTNLKSFFQKKISELLIINIYDTELKLVEEQKLDETSVCFKYELKSNVKKDFWQEFLFYKNTMEGRVIKFVVNEKDLIPLKYVGKCKYCYYNPALTGEKCPYKKRGVGTRKRCNEFFESYNFS